MKMKKRLAFALLGIVAAFSAVAVPRGCYYDRGVHKAIVNDAETIIYVLDREGYVKHELIILNEESDGRFKVRDTKTGIEHYQNAWWEENGNIYLNLQWLPNTVTRQ